MLLLPRHSVLLVLACLVLAGGAAMPAIGQEGTPEADCPTTSVAENRAIAASVQEILSSGDLDAFDAIFAPDIVGHQAVVPDSVGLEDTKQTYAVVRTGFPDYQATVEETVAEGDVVVVRWTATGTHLGPFPGSETPTGKPATWTGMQMFRFECGKIVEQWTEVDGVARMQQLGLLPGASPVATPQP